jgi:2-amino-4-hydroxy-6-hydroxymethyldihydropteridine diphosphokinase
MNHAIVGIGSNIDPGRNIRLAIERMEQRHHVVACSSLVETAPIGPPDQPNYLNGAVLLETAMELDELRMWLRDAESELGRVRSGEKYGPRTIDLDLVVWNGEVVHPDVFEREFLRRSVLEVAPDLSLK